jgi:hypothetical protein
LSAIPTLRHEAREHVEKVVQHMATFVGEEQFLLRVGQSLIKRSADVGLVVDGVVTGSGLNAEEIVDQPLQDVHIDKHNVFSVPLADAIAFFGACKEFTVLRRQAFEALKAKGMSDKQIIETLNDPEVKEVMQKTAEVSEKIKTKRIEAQEKFDVAAAEILQRYQSTSPQKLDELVAILNADVTEKGVPLEYEILKRNAKTDAQAETYNDMVELTRLRCEFEQVVKKHPTAARILTQTLKGIEWAADKMSDCVAILAGGAYGMYNDGALGIVDGARKGLAVKAEVGKWTAAAIDHVVGVATKNAVATGKTPRERQEFSKTVEFWKTTSLSAFGLLGFRHFLKPGPSGKVASAQLKKTLERPVVRDGRVLLGKNDLGHISEMPTVRTFAKPTDAVLRHEFQSDVFNREVMFHGPGTGYDYRVYQRNDIDWGLVRTNPKNAPRFIGKTNLEAAIEGISPELADGSALNLHHIGQKGSGPLVEVSSDLHKKAPIHRQFEGQANINDPVNRRTFDVDRRTYWQRRAENVSKK